MLGYKGSCKVIPSKQYTSSTPEQPNEIRVDFSSVKDGQIGTSLNFLQTRNRETSMMISLSDEDYEYLKEHWAEMERVERFWWMHDHGLYSRFVPIQEENN